MNIPSRRQALLSLLRALPDELDAQADINPQEMPLQPDTPRIAVGYRLGSHRQCVVHDADPQRDAWATVECHLGPPPDDAGATLAQLLALNFEASSMLPCLYALDADTQDVVLIRLVPIDNCTPVQLAGHVLNAVALADAWRQAIDQQAEHSSNNALASVAPFLAA